MKQFESKITMFRLSLLMMLLLVGGLSAYARQTKIIGAVTDPGGEPLIGVTGKVQNTGSGVVSYKTAGVSVDGCSVVNVTMKK